MAFSPHLAKRVKLHHHRRTAMLDRDGTSQDGVQAHANENNALTDDEVDALLEELPVEQKRLLASVYADAGLSIQFEKDRLLLTSVSSGLGLSNKGWEEATIQSLTLGKNENDKAGEKNMNGVQSGMTKRKVRYNVTADRRKDDGRQWQVLFEIQAAREVRFWDLSNVGPDDATRHYTLCPQHMHRTNISAHCAYPSICEIDAHDPLCPRHLANISVRFANRRDCICGTDIPSPPASPAAVHRKAEPLLLRQPQVPDEYKPGYMLPDWDWEEDAEDGDALPQMPTVPQVPDSSWSKHWFWEETEYDSDPDVDDWY